MPSKKWKFLEHTADLKFLARGETLGECFQNSAEAMFSEMLDLNSVSEKIRKEIEMDADNLEGLLHDFLSELLFLFETSQIVFKNFEVEIRKKNKKYFLEAIAAGEKVNPKKHQIHTEIKAVTYHDLSVEEEGNEWRAIVLCDI